MAEVEYQGVKVSGGKLLLILPLLGSLGGGLWAGFEFYKDYMNMKEQIANYVAPDLSGIDKQQALITQGFEQVERDFTSLKEIDQAMEEKVRIEVNSMKESLGDVKSDLQDVKRELKDDMTAMFSVVDKQDARNRDNVETVRGVINAFEIRMDSKIDRLDKKIDELEDALDNKIRRALDNPLANGG